jgi:RimJ/RimL family protein N-acetyltransferase
MSTTEKNDMIQIIPDQITPELESLFDADMPVSIRCYGVLDGQLPGRIFTDDVVNPTRIAVQESVDGTVYLGGSFDSERLQQLITDLRRDSDVLFGMWHDDERLKLLPPNPDYDGLTLDFTGRPIGHGLANYLGQLPAGCEVRRMDSDLLERSLDRDYTLDVFGTAENALKKGIGYCLLKDSEVVSEAFAAPLIRYRLEMGTKTHPDHRGKGYATLVCAHLIRTCEQLGFDTYWNCAKQNLASAVIARKLGYRNEREYRLLAWFKTKA